MLSAAEFVFVPLLIAQPPAQAPTPEPPTAQYAALPMGFEPDRVRGFVARGSGYSAVVDAAGARLALKRAPKTAPAHLQIAVSGADPEATGVGIRPLPGQSHYLLGRDPAAWRTGVPQFERVRYRGVLPGIDVEYYGNQRRLEFDFIVAPGTDAVAIELRFSGAARLALEPSGSLTIAVDGAELTQQAPVAYQELNGRRSKVASRYVLRGDSSVGFAIGTYDRSRPLIIDPTLAYGTYFGGSGGETINGLARDAAGNLYVAGVTSSTDLPLANPAQSQIRALYDFFVAKLDPTGTQLLYSTYIGGDGASGEDEWPLGIGVDSLGRAVVMGRTESTDFPIVSAAQPTPGGNGRVDGVVFMLDPTGSQLVYSTYLGGSDHDLDYDNAPVGGGEEAAGGIAVDAAGNATVVGITWSTDFPTVNPMQAQHKGGSGDGFIVRYDPTGQVVYSTYFGGSSFDQIRDAYLGPQGHVYLTGESRSDDLPITAGAYQTSSLLGFATVFDPVNQSVVRSTFFPDRVNCIAADPAGNVYLAGTTRGGIPTTPGAYQTQHGGSFQSHWEQGFVCKLDSDLSTVLYGTYYGTASENESFVDIDVDAAGQAYVTGNVSNHWSSLTSISLIAKLNTDASGFPFAMRIAGRNSEGYALVLGDPGSVWVAGETWASTGFATPGALQPVHRGGTDGFLARIDDRASRINSLTLNETRLTGGTAATGTVNLDGVAPTGGIAVALSSSDPAIAAVPVSVVVPAGAASVTFSITGGKVSGPVNATITASWEGARSQSLRVWPGPSYRVLPILTGSPPPRNDSEGHALDDFGTVAGTGNNQFFTFDPAGVLTVLGSGDARDINDIGQIAGGASSAWRYTPGAGMLALGALQPGTWSEGYGLNNRGQVTGESGFTFSGGVSGWRAFRYTDGVGMEDLGSLHETSKGWAINSSGQVAGETEMPGARSIHAMRYTDGIGIEDLGLLPGDWVSYGFAINDAGQVAGRSVGISFNSSRAFRYTDGIGLEDLGLLPGDIHGSGDGINTFGQVAGWSGLTSSQGAGRATHWVSSGPAELADLVSSPDAFAWDLQRATDLNDRGQITGHGTYSGNFGRTTGFRLEPEFFVPYGSGCPGTDRNVPGLMGEGYPVSGNRATLWLSGRPRSAAVLLLGGGRAQTPFMGCDLLVAAPWFVPGPLSVNPKGYATLAIALPAGLPGASVFVQGLVLDSNADNGVFAASNGIEMRIPDRRYCFSTQRPPAALAACEDFRKNLAVSRSCRHFLHAARDVLGPSTDGTNSRAIDRSRESKARRLSMRRIFQWAAVAAAVVLSSSVVPARAPHAAPQITSLSESVVPKSGRLVVFGSGFGASAAQLLIGGRVALVTSWTDTEIHGYVPEATTLGTVQVQVVTGSGASNTVGLSVTARTKTGRISWRFRTDSSNIGGYLATAPDGTVYTSDDQRMYSLAPDGALQWVQPLGAGGQQITLGTDGTIYTGRRGRVVALYPDGAVKWVYDTPNPNAALEAGPAVGPDGNIYAFQDAARGSGLGAFSLDPNGNLRWQALPSPVPVPDINNTAIEFSEPADTRFYFGLTSLRSGPYPSTWAFDFAGKQVWYRDGTCSTGPLLDPQHRIVLGGLGSCGITVIDKDNQTVWNTPPPQLLTWPVGPAVGPDGSAYLADWTGAELWSVDANGNTRWFLPSSSSRGIMKNLSVTPDNKLLLDGGRLTFGVPGWIRAYSTLDGSFQWQENLPREAGFDQETYFLPEFSADGRTAYYNTGFFGSGPGYAYVYAIAVSDDAKWSNYGVGLPGALGVPALTASGDPVLGSRIQVVLANSRGVDTPGVLLLGGASAALPTRLEGTLLVTPTLTVPVDVPVAGLGIGLSIPAAPAFSGVSVYLQDLQIDPAAVRGVSFSAGLQLSLGIQ